MKVLKEIDLEIEYCGPDPETGWSGYAAWFTEKTKEILNCGGCIAGQTLEELMVNIQDNLPGIIDDAKVPTSREGVIINLVVTDNINLTYKMAA